MQHIGQHGDGGSRNIIVSSGKGSASGSASDSASASGNSSGSSRVPMKKSDGCRHRYLEDGGNLRDAQKKAKLTAVWTVCISTIQ